MRLKSPVCAQVRAQALVQLLHHLVGVALQLLGAVLGQLGDRGLRRIPVARAILVEIGGRARQPPQGIAKDRRRLAGHHAAELHPPVLDAPVGGRGRGRRTQVDGARHAPAGRELAEVRHSPSMRSGSEFGPSTSFSITGTQLSER